MSEFSELCQTALNSIEQDMSKNFTLDRDVSLLEHHFPMRASFTSNTPKPFLFFAKSVVGSLCYEHCYFDICEILDENKADDYLKFFEKAHDTLVNPSEQDHEFTFVSFVIFTSGLSRESQKKFKKFSLERKYKAPQTGWSSVRVAVIDVKDKKIYTNNMGGSVKDRLKNPLAQLGF